MKINLNNYEAYFLDYSEGTLSQSDVNLLFDFLEAHPELKEELHSFEPLQLISKEEVSYPEKASLKKSRINEKNYSHFLIASIEGDLNASEQNELSIFLQKNNAAQNDLKLFKKAKLQASEVVVFENKKSLKKGAVIISLSSRLMIAVAASAILVLGIAIFLKSSNKELKENPVLSQTINVKKQVQLQKTAIEIQSILPNMDSKSENFSKPKRKRDRIAPLEKHVKPGNIQDELKREFVSITETTPLKIKSIEPDPVKESEMEMLTPATFSFPEKDSPALASIEKPEEPGFLDKLSMALRMNLKRAIKNKEAKESTHDAEDENSPSGLWNIAEAGTQTLNTLTGTKIILTRTPLPDETTERISLVAGQFQFQTNKEK